jgi:chaperonin GroEL (HSP60 family)
VLSAALPAFGNFWQAFYLGSGNCAGGHTRCQVISPLCFRTACTAAAWCLQIKISGTKTSQAATLLLRGANDMHLDEMDRSLHDALCVVKRVLESGAVVPGGLSSALHGFQFPVVSAAATTTPQLLHAKQVVSSVLVTATNRASRSSARRIAHSKQLC